jgi:hypothetical protein
MYERHKYEKHFLYEAIPEPEEGTPNKVHFQYVHRLHHLPIDLLHVT